MLRRCLPFRCVCIFVASKRVAFNIALKSPICPLSNLKPSPLFFVFLGNDDEDNKDDADEDDNEADEDDDDEEDNADDEDDDEKAEEEESGETVTEADDAAAESSTVRATGCLASAAQFLCREQLGVENTMPKHVCVCVCVCVCVHRRSSVNSSRLCTCV